MPLFILVLRLIHRFICGWISSSIKKCPVSCSLNGLVFSDNYYIGLFFQQLLQYSKSLSFLFHLITGILSWLIGKDSDAGRDWGQEEKGTTEDEIAGWHHWLDGSESQWPPGVGDGQGGLACCDSWGRKESDTTEWLIWSDLENNLTSSSVYVEAQFV